MYSLSEWHEKRKMDKKKIKEHQEKRKWGSEPEHGSFHLSATSLLTSCLFRLSTLHNVFTSTFRDWFLGSTILVAAAVVVLPLFKQFFFFAFASSTSHILSHQKDQACVERITDSWWLFVKRRFRTRYTAELPSL